MNFKYKSHIALFYMIWWKSDIEDTGIIENQIEEAVNEEDIVCFEYDWNEIIAIIWESMKGTVAIQFYSFIPIIKIRDFIIRCCRMDKQSKIYVAGHRGLVGSSIMRILKSKGY